MLFNGLYEKIGGFTVDLVDPNTLVFLDKNDLPVIKISALEIGGAILPNVTHVYQSNEECLSATGKDVNALIAIGLADLYLSTLFVSNDFDTIELDGDYIYIAKSDSPDKVIVFHADYYNGEYGHSETEEWTASELYNIEASHTILIQAGPVAYSAFVGAIESAGGIVYVR